MSYQKHVRWASTKIGAGSGLFWHKLQLRVALKLMWCDLWPLWPLCASASDSRTCPFAPGAGTCIYLGRGGHRWRTPQLIKKSKHLLTRCSDRFLLICILEGKMSWAKVVFWWISSYLMQKDDRKSHNSHGKSISLMSHKSRLIPQEWRSTLM